jgi:hypothetical protein
MRLKSRAAALSSPGSARLAQGVAIALLAGGLAWPAPAQAEAWVRITSTPDGSVGSIDRDSIERLPDDRVRFWMKWDYRNSRAVNYGESRQQWEAHCAGFERVTLLAFVVFARDGSVRSRHKLAGKELEPDVVERGTTGWTQYEYACRAVWPIDPALGGT